MGYSVGETFMVEFVILNSSSLPFKDKYEFEKNIIEFLKVINYLSQKLKNYIKIKTFIEIKDMIIYSNKTLKETIYSIKDEVLRRKLFSLISNRVIKIENPILNKTNENKTYGLKEYKYEDKENKEFGYVDIFGTVLVSFLSNEKWNKIEIELLKISFLENEEIKEEKIKILNISLEKHFEEIKIKEFLKDRKIEIINELIKNYENKKDFLKKVHINKVVEETFTKIKNTRMFEEFVTIVCNLEIGAKEIKDYEIHFKIQFLSIIEILKNILPKMKKQKRGKIIFILSSVTFSTPPKFWAEYVSMKYALLGLLKSLVSEYGEYGIQINGISPSMIDSKLLNNLDPLVKEMSKETHPLKKLITKREIVEFIDFLVTNNSKFLTGNNFNLSGGESI